MKTATKRTKPGPKAKYGKRIPLGLRVTEEMKTRLDQAARENGRSQSQEAEIRLEHSFREEDQLPYLLKLKYGDAGGALLQILGEAMDAGKASMFLTRKSDAISLDSWPFDPFAYEQVVRAIGILLERLRPQGEIPVKEGGNIGSELGGWLALAILGDGRLSADEVAQFVTHRKSLRITEEPTDEG